MHTFFMTPLPPEGGPIRVDKDEAHHVRVRRIRPGETVRLVDGEGAFAWGRYEGEDRFHLQPRAEEALPRTALVLAQAWIPAERLDWAIQKAVESGAAEIVVYGAERKVMKKERAQQREGRWQRIVREAAKQCGRARFPSIAFVPDLASLLQDVAVDVWWMAEQASTRPVFEGQPRRAGLIVGPEGGFSATEREQLHAAGAHAMRLGPWTLRSETVAPAGLALLEYGYDAWPGASLGEKS